MALILMEGFDKYGPSNTAVATVQTLLQAEWTTSSATANSIAAPLSSTGQALQIGYNAGAAALAKTLPASYGRLIGGARFRVDVLGGVNCGVGFQDAGTAQCSLVVNASTGLISLRNGTVSGTVLATSGAAISIGAINFLEWDIAFGNSAAYQVWLNGVSLFTGTGDTTGTANNSANGFVFIGAGGGHTIIWDDLYLFDTSGATNNAVLLTSPRIETSFPSADSTTQFTAGAAVVGNSVVRNPVSSSVSGNANELRLKPVTPGAGCTLVSIAFSGGSTGNTASNFRPVVYADSSGVPGALLGSGATIAGPAAQTLLTMPLSSGVALTAGTQYWIGLMQSVTGTNTFWGAPGATDRVASSVSFASGAPSTAPSTSPTANIQMYGNVTTSANWYAAGQNPTQGLSSYVYDATIGHEDLYAYPTLSVPPSVIYAVAVKAVVAKSDAGTKTVSVRMKSGATDSAGTGGAAIAPSGSFLWLTSHYETDPATTAAWILSALNAATSGLKVES